MTTRDALKEYVASTGGIVAASRAIGCRHPALIDWISGRRTPDYAWRFAIQRFTRGAIKAAQWETEHERQIIRAARPTRPTP